jgi:hypothetical protein
MIPSWLMFRLESEYSHTWANPCYCSGQVALRGLGLRNSDIRQLYYYLYVYPTLGTVTKTNITICFSSRVTTSRPRPSVHQCSVFLVSPCPRLPLASTLPLTNSLSKARQHWKLVQSGIARPGRPEPERVPSHLCTDADNRAPQIGKINRVTLQYQSCLTFFLNQDVNNFTYCRTLNRSHCNKAVAALWP